MWQPYRPARRTSHHLLRQTRPRNRAIQPHHEGPHFQQLQHNPPAPYHSHRNGIHSPVLAQHICLKDGISKTQSLSEIILSHNLNFNAHCKVEFCEYVQTHKEHDNTIQSHTIRAIVTRPSNYIGGSYFISLSKGHCINHHRWTPMPILLEVVA